MRSFTRMGGMEPEKIPILRRGFGCLGIYIYIYTYIYIATRGVGS